MEENNKKTVKESNNCRKSIKKEILIKLSLLSLFIVVTVSFSSMVVTYMNHQEEMQEDFENVSDNVYTAVRDQIGFYMRYTMLSLSDNRVVEFVANSGMIDEQNQKIVAQSFMVEAQTSPNISEIAIANKDGAIFYSTNESSVGKSVDKMDYYDQIKNDKMISISKPINEIDKEPDRANESCDKMAIVAPIVGQDGELIGTIIKVMNISLCDKVFEKYTEQNYTFYILNSSGVVFYSNNKNAIGRENKSEEVYEFFNREDDTHEMKEIDGVMYYYTYDKAEDMLLISEIDKEDISSKGRVLIITLVIIGVMTLFLALIIAYKMSKKIVSPIVYHVNRVNDISSGDFTVDIAKSKEKNEIGLLNVSIRKMKDNIKQLVQHSSDSIDKIDEATLNLSAISEEVVASNAEVSRAIDNISNKVQNQADSINIGTEKTTELGTDIDDLEKTNENMEARSKEVINSINDGQTKVNYLLKSNEDSEKSFNDVMASTEKLVNQVNSIESIVEVIDSISSQTSLLSLNASIESARAGEAGKGFAVVASEIGKLAEETQNATKRIQDIIESTEKIAEDANNSIRVSNEINLEQKKAVDEMNKAFNMMENRVQNMIESITEISEKVKHINLTKNEVNDLMTNIDAVAQDIVCIVEEVGASCTEQMNAFSTVNGKTQDLIELSQNLKKSISVFKI